MKGLYIQTYGCQMNESDSERMKAVLAPLNFEEVKTPMDAELVLVNTCSIRDKAEKKTHSFSYELKKLKKSKPEMMIGVTGCVAQQEKEQLAKDLPFVDLFLGPDNIDELPWVIDEVYKKRNLNEKSAVQRTEFIKNNDRLWRTKTKINNPGPSVFMNVMKGCDHFCSYCIVPWTRGREKSRPIADIYTDLKELTEQGVKEVTFLGQNINSFGKRNDESLHELFYKVHEIEGLERIRFTTSHPGDLQDGLIQAYRDLPKLCSYFHLPVQSGSNKVLRQMRRFYTLEDYKLKVDALRAARPDIALSSDIIVGFPGETEEDFQKSLEVLAYSRFDNLYSFTYSARPGTAAAKRPDPISEPLKKERLYRLQDLAREISREEHQKQLGKTVEVLIEGPSKKNAERWTGRNSQNVPTHFAKNEKIRVGDYLKFKVTETHLTHLIGEPLNI